MESAQDVLEELGPDSAPERVPAYATLTADADEPVLLQALGHDPVGLDALQARTGLPTPELLAGLMTLELQGLVARRPGGLFQRMVRA